MLQGDWAPQLLSLHSGAHELQLVKPMHLGAHAPQQEKLWQWELRVPQHKAYPPLLQLEKARAQQQRPSAAINKYIKLKKKKKQQQKRNQSLVVLQSRSQSTWAQQFHSQWLSCDWEVHLCLCGQMQSSERARCQLLVGHGWCQLLDSLYEMSWPWKQFCLSFLISCSGKFPLTIWLSIHKPPGLEFGEQDMQSSFPNFMPLPECSHWPRVWASKLPAGGKTLILLDSMVYMWSILILK